MISNSETWPWNSDRELAKLKKICRKYRNNEDYVYKSCFDKLSKKSCERKWLVVMKKIPTTITNESRSGVVDKNCAMFKANRLLVVAIINKNKPSLRKKYVLNKFRTMEKLYEVGKIVECNGFYVDIDKVCSYGIHYFKTLEPAYFYTKYVSHGRSMQWYESGQKRKEENHINGILNGLCTEWNSNGTIRRESFHTQNGKTESIFTKWHDIDGNFLRQNTMVYVHDDENEDDIPVS